MANIMKKAVVIGSFAAALSLAAAAPSSAQTVTVEPTYAGPPQGYVDPYAAYAYSPGPRVERAWEFPAGYESTGQAFSYRELGVKPGPSSGAPAHPCFLSQRVQNRC